MKILPKILWELKRQLLFIQGQSWVQNGLWTQWGLILLQPLSVDCRFPITFAICLSYSNILIYPNTLNYWETQIANQNLSPSTWNRSPSGWYVSLGKQLIDYNWVIIVTVSLSIATPLSSFSDLGQTSSLSRPLNKRRRKAGLFMCTVKRVMLINRQSIPEIREK